MCKCVCVYVCEPLYHKQGPSWPAWKKATGRLNLSAEGDSSLKTRKHTHTPFLHFDYHCASDPCVCDTRALSFAEHSAVIMLNTFALLPPPWSSAAGSVASQESSQRCYVMKGNMNIGHQLGDLSSYETGSIILTVYVIAGLSHTCSTRHYGCDVVCYLIGVGPECWNGQFSLHPAFSHSVWGVPHWVPLGSSIHLKNTKEGGWLLV